MRLMVVEPLLILSHQAPVVNSISFFLIVLSTALVAAGGYVINDIQDVETDAINKPEKVIAGRLISIDNSWNYYLILTFTGICIGLFLMFRSQIKYIAYVQIISAGLLYFYSTTYKQMLLVGNIIVAALTSLSLALVYLTEPDAPSIEPLKALVTGYVVFAFIISLAREIIKDIQDVNGDKNSGARTFPIIAGIKTSKITACILLLFIFFALVAIQLSSHQWESMISFIYVIVFIQIPLILLLVSVFNSSVADDYLRCSVLAKIIMVTGILSMPVFYYSFNQ
jgi:4-hydroxybenzoate polyprenyltransferase